MQRSEQTLALQQGCRALPYMTELITPYSHFLLEQHAKHVYQNAMQLRNDQENQG